MGAFSSSDYFSFEANRSLTPNLPSTPSLYESFIHNTLPAFTGALNLER